MLRSALLPSFAILALSLPSASGCANGAFDSDTTSAAETSFDPRFRLTLGTDFPLSGAETHIQPVKDSGGAYQGYFNAESDPMKLPFVRVEIRADGGALAVGDYPCSRAEAAPHVQTSLYIKLDDRSEHSFWSNVLPNPTCVVHVRSITEASVAIEVAGDVVAQEAPYPRVPVQLTFLASRSPYIAHAP